MGAATKLLEKKVLRELVPLNALSAIHLEEISRKAVIEELRAGRYLFRKGDQDGHSIYVIKGKIELLDEGRQAVGWVEAGSETAGHPLAHKQPRQLSARAASAATVLRIDSSLLDILLTWDQSSCYDVVEIDADENQDWMTRVLQSQVFLQLPPSNIQQLLMRLEEVSLNAGDAVVRQGDDGDYFYIVKSGRLAVSRKASESSKEVILAELGEGAFFGEDALVSGTTRNASVAMITDGTLMRLSKGDFNDLLRVRMVHEVQFDEAIELVARGAQWLDVRLPGEFENQALEGSRNLPLSALREQSSGLDTGVEYIVCCDTGRRSATAAFVLAQCGFQVYTLKNGLMDVPDQAFSGGRGSGGTVNHAQDAEIIPFGTDAKHQGRASKHDGEREATEEVLQQVLGERVELERQLEQRRLELESADSRLVELRGLHEQQQREHEKKTRMLEEELQRLRGKAAQLARRTSTLTGERDGAVAGHERLKNELRALKDALASERKETAIRNDGFKRSIEEHEKALKSERQQGRTIQQQLSELEQSRKQSDQALRKALDREQDLRTQLQQVEQRAQSDRETASSEAKGMQEALHQRIAELQAELEGRQKRLEDQRAELENRLVEVQQSLESMTGQARRAEQELSDVQQGAAESRKEAEREREHSSDLQQKLEALQKQLADSEQRAADFEKRLTQTVDDYESDIASVRDALGRAQEERENVKRDQKSLMDTLRTTERKLERERQEHEDEMRRLRKELSQAAGESDAGLTAELEALRERLQQDMRDRDELEIKLGERSAQLEDLQSQVDRLSAQLSEVHGKAQRAEQRLAEAKTAANEELASRLAAEQQRQQALREDLNASLQERDSIRRELEHASREAQELREAVESARSELQSRGGNDRQIEALRSELQRVKAERDTARNAEQRFREEAGQLHAEGETSRALEQLLPSEGDSTLMHEGQGQATAAEVPVLQHPEAAEQVLALQDEVDRLRAELNRVQADESPQPESVAIGSLEELDPFAAALTSGDSAESAAAPDTTPAQPVLPDRKQFGADVAETSRVPIKGLVVGALAAVAVALLATGALWWLQGPGIEAFREMRIPTLSFFALSDSSPAASQGASDEPVAGQMSDPANAGSASSPLQSGEGADTAGEAEPAAGLEAAGKEDAPPPVSAEDAGRAQSVTQPGATFRDRLGSGGRGPSMVELHADSFRMGSGSASPHFDERPRHEVNVKRFAISKHEITFQQYDRFAEATGRARPRGAARGLRPVVRVTWHDAVAYAEWLSTQTGRRYRLPTEAEWEFAARAGGVTRFPWGNRVGKQNANCFDCGTKWSGRETAPVGSFAASAFGLHDMAGNVREWVKDCYVASYKDAPADGGAVEVPGCEERVIRGGSYSSPSSRLRVTARGQSEPGTRLDDLGFRVVREY